MRENQSTVMWGSALNHTFPDHVTHRALSLSSSLALLFFFSSVFPSLSSNQDHRFPQTERFQITRFISRLAIPIASRVQPDMACIALKTLVNQTQIREFASPV